MKTTNTFPTLPSKFRRLVFHVSCLKSELIFPRVEAEFVLGTLEKTSNWHDSYGTCNVIITP